MEIKKRVVTKEKALCKLMSLCSVAEKSSGDAIRLLKRWEISESDSQQIVQKLKKEKYIDDSRYCKSYIREKTRYSGWGVKKIEQALLMKGIERDEVKKWLDEYVSKDEMEQSLRHILERKLKEIERKEDNKYKIKDKLFRFALSRGYEYDNIVSEIEKLLGL